MCVRDNGKGMEVATPLKANTNGLRIMRYRAEAAGGELLIESPASSGVQVTLAIPKGCCQS